MGPVSWFNKKFAETKAREAAIRANPELVNSPEVKHQQRNAGWILCVTGVVIAVANGYAWISVGYVLIWGIVLPVIFIPSGIYMMITGKNPFLQLKK